MNHYIEEDDYIIASNGFRLSVSRNNTAHVGDCTTEDEAEDLIREDAANNGWWPDVWYISDHGNVSPYEMEFGAECPWSKCNKLSAD